MSLVQTYSGAPLDVAAGRVAVVDLGATALRVVAAPAQGNVSVNPDGTLAVVLTDPGYRGPLSFTAEVSGSDGPRTVTVDLDVEAGSQASGWGRGDHYTLQTDAQGDTVVEPGQNHRKVYVSESSQALSRADIAQRESVSVGTIDGAWLAAHPEYGASEGMALDTEAGIALWQEITVGWKNGPSSDWLLFERGYQYTNTGRLIEPGADGESALHPLMIGAWGQGARPILDDPLFIFQEISRNIVVQDVEFPNGVQALVGENLLFDDLKISSSSREGVGIQDVSRFTLQDSQVIDVILNGAGGTVSGLFLANIDGVLIDGVLIDHSGWADGYETDSSVMPANANSHNLYAQFGTTDVTFRDNVSMRGSSFGAQFRSGAVVEGNLLADNNVALSALGGGDLGSRGFDGNYSLIVDNVVTSAGHKEGGGAPSWGIQSGGADASLVRNIVAHLADPSDPAERQSKTDPGQPLILEQQPFVDDTIIYNWITDLYRTIGWFQDPEQNVPSIPTSQLDEVTLRRFYESVTGQSAPADDVDALADWFAANWDSLDGASSAIDFFQQGFGIGQASRGSATTLRFVPDPVGEGTRWDNRLNWSTDDLPGTAAGDSVDLHGNWVDYAGTTKLQALDLGDRGKLSVRQGYLETGRLDVGSGGGRIEVGLAGQFWTDGYGDADQLTVVVDGGRFANTGRFDGDADLTVTGGEVLLATSGGRFTVDGTLAIAGDTAHVGFDGQGGSATLDFAAGATLRLVAGQGGVSALGEFRSGHYGTAAPNLGSTIDFTGADLDLDLGALSTASRTYTLAAADTLRGGFDSVSLGGMAASKVDLSLDFGADTLTLDVTQSGQGGLPELELVGSGSGDVFHLAAGAAMRVRGYESNDVIDVSAVLDQGATGSLQLASGSGNQVVLSGRSGGSTVQLAVIEGASGGVTVQAGGQTLLLQPDGSAQPAPPLAVPPAANADPVAEDGQVSGDADGTLSGSLSATDDDGDTLSFALASGPAQGQVTVNADGSFSYDPAGAYDDLPQGQTATESFDYTVSDGQGGSDSGTVTLTIQGTAAAPDSGGSETPTTPPQEPTTPPQEAENPTPTASNADPVAEDGQVSGDADGTLSGSLSATDDDGDTLSFALASGPAQGQVTVNADGSFSYDPAGAYDDLPQGQTATESFDYTVSDGQGGSDSGTVTLTIQGTAAAPAPAPEELEEQPSPPPEQEQETPAPEPEEEPETPAWNVITGTSGWDNLRGTEGADLIRSGGGAYDQVWGKGGGDAFVFGAKAGDGRMDNVHVRDFEAGIDMIVLEQGAVIGKVSEQQDSVWIRLEGNPEDLIMIDGPGVTFDGLNLVQTDDAWMG